MPKTKVPAHIRKAIRTKAKHNAIAYEADKVIRDWLYSIGHGEDDSFLDILVDDTEQSADGSERCIKTFESML
jgi:hypothetical protein